MCTNLLNFLIWTKHIKLFDNIKLVDPTIFQDKDNQIWLFANTSNSQNNFNSQLNIYKIEDNFLKVIPHKNPVINNYTNGRGAGNIFYNKDGELQGHLKTIPPMYRGS